MLRVRTVRNKKQLSVHEMNLEDLRQALLIGHIPHFSKTYSSHMFFLFFYLIQWKEIPFFLALNVVLATLNHSSSYFSHAFYAITQSD